ncbi:iron-containing alcohol dehydrogenase family protein [Tepidibacter aestuarii]|uniref:iron-containing alcohol dehydrogenase family protein n=1 Tax=Tepidibacter aestuarii TaxID=2925782 RepID=UPI0020C01F3A|nr:iron-containing alcohol dehydrogenase [Tepidibacter aestuarii]CAH2212984.1 Alcohol dehydrogenase [Tepidibacter aestuarii]
MQLFEIPSKVFFGEGSLKKIKDIISEHQVSKMLLICDKRVKQVGIVDLVLEHINTENVDVLVFDGVIENPTDTMVKECVQEYKEKDIDLIIAVGGGSAIDSSKAINILLSNQGNIRDYEGFNLVKNPGLPLIAIPTTAGSASEVTNFAVITDTHRKIKMVIGGKNINADYAIVDSKLTIGLPPSITATTGMAALTHAIEAYVSKFSNEFTNINALRSIELISNNIEEAVENSTNLASRENMMNGSLLAGFACNCALLGLVHGIGHPLGAYFNIAHGVASAIMLPFVVEYNAPYMKDKLNKIGRAMKIKESQISADSVVAKIHELNRNIGVPKLSDIGITKDDCDIIANAAMDEIGLIMNPRKAKIEDVKEILRKALKL